MKIEPTLIVNSDNGFKSSIQFSDAEFLESAFRNIYNKEKEIMKEGPTLNIELGSLDSGLKINSISTTYSFAKGINISNSLSKYNSSDSINNLYGDGNKNNTNSSEDSSLIITVKPDGTVITNKPQGGSSSSKPQDDSSSNNTVSNMDLTPSKVEYEGKTGLIFDTTKPKPSKDEVIKMVEEIAPKYGLEPDMVKAVIETESSFNNQTISNKGAVGLMQLMPDAAREMGLIVNDTIDERWDPKKNIEAGIKYLAKCRSIIGERTGNYSWDFAFAGYNQGPYGVAKLGYLTEAAKKYVTKVNKFWSQYK